VDTITTTAAATATDNVMTKNKTEHSQIERFKEAARELGTDDDEEQFNEKLRKLAKQKPTPDPKERE
jgi:hypothetical protein